MVYSLTQDFLLAERFEFDDDADYPTQEVIVVHLASNPQIRKQHALSDICNPFFCNPYIRYFLFYAWRYSCIICKCDMEKWGPATNSNVEENLKKEGEGREGEEEDEKKKKKIDSGDERKM